MKTHELKTCPEYFQAIRENRKTFEVRRDDRGFEVGDQLLLREWDPATSEYSGEEMSAVVTYALRNPDFVLPGFVIMGLGEVRRLHRFSGGK